MNELGVLVERGLRAKGWALGEMLLRADLSADAAFRLFGQARLPQMPSQATIAALAGALDLPYREVVMAAAAACGVATTPAGGRDVTLSQVTHEELLRELRRRSFQDRRQGEARRRLAHLALAGQALSQDAG
jgi:hypothetical protein